MLNHCRIQIQKLRFRHQQDYIQSDVLREIRESKITIGN